MSFEFLPYDIYYYEILPKLEFEDLLKLRLCNKNINSIIYVLLKIPKIHKINEYNNFKKSQKFLQNLKENYIITENILLLKFLHTKKNNVISMYPTKISYKSITSSFVYIDTKISIKKDFDKILSNYKTLNISNRSIIKLYKQYKKLVSKNTDLNLK